MSNIVFWVSSIEVSSIKAPSIEYKICPHGIFVGVFGVFAFLMFGVFEGSLGEHRDWWLAFWIWVCTLKTNQPKIPSKVWATVLPEGIPSKNATSKSHAHLQFVQPCQKTFSSCKSLEYISSVSKLLTHRDLEFYEPNLCLHNFVKSPLTREIRVFDPASLRAEAAVPYLTWKLLLSP